VVLGHDRYRDFCDWHGYFFSYPGVNVNGNLKSPAFLAVVLTKI